MKRMLHPLRIAALVASPLIITHPASGQTVWSGGGGVNKNWSATANWYSGATPSASDTALFGVDATVGNATTINNTVDTTTTIAALNYTNSVSGTWHVTEIPSGVVLSVSGGMTVGGGTANGLVTSAALVGGGTFEVSGSPLNVGNNGSSSLDQNTILDMSGLSNFVYNAAVGTVATGTGNRSVAGIVLAARSNSITAATINLNTSASSSSGSSTALRFGSGTNIINADALNFAAGRSSATVNFLTASGGLCLRGTGGTDTDRTTLTLGHRNAGSSTGGTTTGTLSCNGHPVDMKIATLILGRNSRNGTEVNLHGVGVFQFDQGTVDATTINMGVMSGTSPSASADGTLAVGANGTLTVQSVSLANMTSSGAGSTATGNLNIFGGVVNCSGDIVKSTVAGTGNIGLDSGGRLNLGPTNRLGTAGIPLDRLAMTNSFLQLPVKTGEASANVGTLVTGGTTNRISITGTIPPVTGYPAQFTVVKYSGSIGGVGFNFGLGTLPASIGDPYVGYLSNNTANGSVDLVLTSGLVPAKTITWNGAPTANWEAGSGTVANWLLGSAPTNFSQTDFVTFDDSASGVTTVNLTTALLPTAVTVNNSTKSYTFSGPGSLSGATGLTKEGSGTLTIANDVANDFSGTIAINGGTLRYSQPDGITVANVISGAGTLSHAGSGGLTLSGASTLTGPITVTQGTLIVGNNSALGTTNGSTTIASGAALDINGPTGNTRRLGAEPIIVAGAGVGGLGAIVNNSGNDAYPAVSFVTLTANTTFGGSGRWDLRATGSGLADPATAALSTSGQPYNLTKVGANRIAIANATVDPALANVDVQAGILQLNGNITGLGNPANTLSIQAFATLSLFDMTNRFNKQIVLADSATLENTSGANTIIGPITLNGLVSFNILGTSLTLDSTLSGAGILSKSGASPLTFNGNGSGLSGGVVANNGGRLILNGVLGGGLTNYGSAAIMGTGTNSGVVDAWGAIVPGASNSVGTLTFGSLILEPTPDAYLALDLGPNNTPGSGNNDLIQVNGDLTVNGNSLIINPQGLLLEGAGNPYTVIRYTGALIENAPLTASGPYNYTFTLDTSVPHEIRLVASGGPPVWTGGSATVNNWSDPANWGGTTIAPGDSLYFSGGARLNNNTDTLADTLYNNLTFVAGAEAFSLNGNSVNLGSSIVNDSLNPQTINLNLSLAAANTFSGSSGPLVIGGDVLNTVNLATLTLGGTGVLSNRLASAGAVTNTLVLNDTNANWTLRDSPSSTAVTNPTALDIQAGTFNFGQAASAPVLASTAAINARLGAIGGAPAVFNMVNGTLIIPVRFNLGTAGNTIATLNQSGGLISVEDVLQGSDGSATAVSTINVSGGTLSVGETETSPNTFFLCSRGTGTLTLSSSGLVRCGTFDVSRNVSALGTIGVVNLDGGTLNATRVSTGTSSFTAGGTPSATFNFNGGTLKARASSTTYFQGRTELPITAIVKAGGAIIDSDINAISVLEPLQHDGALGGTPDGGLTKLGTGTLTLTAANTYTGPTLVNNGTLVVSGSLAATATTVASSGRLGGTGSIGGTATVNAGGTVAPGTATGIGTLTVANAILNGSTFIKLNKSATPAVNDVLAATAISLGGTLDATNAGPMLNSGDSFTVFSGGLSGSIVPGTLPPLWPGLTWDTTQLNTAGRISVTGTLIPPQITGGISGTNFVLTGSGGVQGAAYRVLASPNVAAPPADWIPVATNVFDSSGNLNVSLGVNPGIPMLFYRVTVP